MRNESKSENPVRINGLDYLRSIGVVLVLVQHQLAILDFEHITSAFGLNIGQAGVSIFLAVSGVLAANSRGTPSSMAR